MDTLSEDDDELGADLAAMRPAQDDAYARTMQATIRGALVGVTGDPFQLGRFTVLGPLGGGGMGVVFVAYDRNLDRKIALKVLRNRGERGRREVMREGRALARLKHPNVVTVYEVGEIDDQVFVAMEYIDGEHLRDWLRAPRSSAAILARLVEAGRGLAAAHAVGLVHRDFKPENIVIAGDLARVIDFGLARPVGELSPADEATHATVSTRSMHGGTPAYMAPERLGGAPGDAAADQWAFCVTAWEALLGARPTAGERPLPSPAPGRDEPPRWLRRVLERGLQPDPARRWPSMTGLLAAIDRGRRRSRLGLAALGVLAVVAVAGGAEALRRRDVAARVAACEATGAEFDATWNDETRRRVRAAFAATDLAYAAATADKVIPRLDDAALAWQTARTDACLAADVRGEWDADTEGRATYCLEERQLDLTAAISAFVRADTNVVRTAPRTVGGLRAAGACLDPALLQRDAAPPVNVRPAVRDIRVALAHARTLGLTGDFAGAVAAAAEARARAEVEVDWPPLWAAARAMEGAYLEETGALAQAEQASKEAYFAAARAGAWTTAADAATKLIVIVGHGLRRHDDGRDWADHAKLAIAHAGDWHGLAEAWRLSNLGNVHEAAGALPEARALYEQALAIWEAALGPEHPEVAIGLTNLGNIHYHLGAYPEARALLERVPPLWDAAFGPEHPHAAYGLENLANVYTALGLHGEARALYERGLAIQERAFGHDHPRLADALNNLGALHGYTGDYAAAGQLFARVLAIREKALGPDHPECANALDSLAGVATETGDLDGARVFAERALAIKEKALDGDHPSLAVGLVTLAGAHTAAGAYDAAQPLFERALEIQERALGPTHPMVANTLALLGRLLLRAGRPADALPRLVRAVTLLDAYPALQFDDYRAHFDLAQALVATHGDPVRARSAATRALDAWRSAGPAWARDLAALETWLAAQAPAASP